MLASNQETQLIKLNGLISQWNHKPVQRVSVANLEAPGRLAPHTKKREKHRETTKEKEEAHEENLEYRKQKGEDEQIPCGLRKSYTKSLRKH